jgi:hypothetical protein
MMNVYIHTLTDRLKRLKRDVLLHVHWMLKRLGIEGFSCKLSRIHSLNMVWCGYRIKFIVSGYFVSMLSVIVF